MLEVLPLLFHVCFHFCFMFYLVVDHAGTQLYTTAEDLTGTLEAVCLSSLPSLPSFCLVPSVSYKSPEPQFTHGCGLSVTGLIGPVLSHAPLYLDVPGTVIP